MTGPSSVDEEHAKARASSSEADLEARLAAWLAEDPWRLSCLDAVASLGLPEAWIGAGFLRNLVWDRLHGFARPTPLDDVDVLIHDPATADPRPAERALEAALRARLPGVPWSVRNQARMHLRNGDAPYADVADAIAHWLETPTAVAARLRPTGGRRLDILAPFGLSDLFAMTVRPTPHAAARDDRRAAYARRLAEKAWRRRWPGARLVTA